MIYQFARRIFIEYFKIIEMSVCVCVHVCLCLCICLCRCVCAFVARTFGDLFISHVIFIWWKLFTRILCKEFSPNRMQTLMDRVWREVERGRTALSYYFIAKYIYLYVCMYVFISWICCKKWTKNYKRDSPRISDKLNHENGLNAQWHNIESMVYVLYTQTPHPPTTSTTFDNIDIENGDEKAMPERKTRKNPKHETQSKERNHRWKRGISFHFYRHFNIEMVSGW